MLQFSKVHWHDLSAQGPEAFPHFIPFPSYFFFFPFSYNSAGFAKLFLSAPHAKSTSCPQDLVHFLKLSTPGTISVAVLISSSVFKPHSLSAALLPILPQHLMPNIHLFQYVPEALSLPFSNSEKPAFQPIHQHEPFLPPLSQQQPFTTIKYNSQELCLGVFIASPLQSKAKRKHLTYQLYHLLSVHSQHTWVYFALSSRDCSF